MHLTCSSAVDADTWLALPQKALVVFKALYSLDWLHSLRMSLLRADQMSESQQFISEVLGLPQLQLSDTAECFETVVLAIQPVEPIQSFEHMQRAALASMDQMSAWAANRMLCGIDRLEQPSFVLDGWTKVQ